MRALVDVSMVDTSDTNDIDSADSAGHYFEINREIRFRRLGDEAVVIRQQAGEVLVLNDLAARLLELVAAASVDRERTQRRLIERLAEEYEDPAGSLAEDVRGFLQELCEAGVLRGVGTS